MKTTGVFSAIVALVVGAAAIAMIGDGLIAFIFGFSIALWPMALSLQLALRWKGNRKAQGTLAIGNTLYALCFVLICLDAFYWHPDAQSGIVLLFVAFYSLPVMIPIWILAGRLARKSRERNIGASDG